VFVAVPVDVASQLFERLIRATEPALLVMMTPFFNELFRLAPPELSDLEIVDRLNVLAYLFFVIALQVLRSFFQSFQAFPSDSFSFQASLPKERRINATLCLIVFLMALGIRVCHGDFMIVVTRDTARRNSLEDAWDTLYRRVSTVFPDDKEHWQAAQDLLSGCGAHHAEGAIPACDWVTLVIPCEHPRVS